LFCRRQLEAKGHAQSVIAAGELRVNFEIKTVEVNGQLVVTLV
jgi:hypothetical protein